MNGQQPSMIDDARKTGGFLVALLHASVVGLRLVSRRPGSMGAGYMFPNILWSYACMGIFQALLGEPGGLPSFYFVQATGWLWLVHVIAYLRTHRHGVGTYSHDLGRGWLKDGLASDMVTAVVIAGLAFYGDDPGLGAWMMFNLLLTCVSQALIETRDAARKRQIRSAMQLQQYYQDLMQMDDDLE
jgi:hypothetical protein